MYSRPDAGCRSIDCIGTSRLHHKRAIAWIRRVLRCHGYTTPGPAGCLLPWGKLHVSLPPRAGSLPVSPPLPPSALPLPFSLLVGQSAATVRNVDSQTARQLPQHTAPLPLVRPPRGYLACTQYLVCFSVLVLVSPARLSLSRLCLGIHTHSSTCSSTCRAARRLSACLPVHPPTMSMSQSTSTSAGPRSTQHGQAAGNRPLGCWLCWLLASGCWLLAWLGLAWSDSHASHDSRDNLDNQ